MKLTSIIKKNFKLLIRSKTSAFTVLVGPLLIILLVGLVFSGKTSYDLSIGYYTPMHNNLTASFIGALEQGHYYIQEFDSEQDCIKKIEQGVIHTCIIFPRNFQISNEQSNELRFSVDNSRMNLVYKVIDSVSGLLEVESKELSYSLTQVLLSRINTTLKSIDADLLLMEETNPKLNLLAVDLQKALIDSKAMKFDMRDVSVLGLDKGIESLSETILEVKEKNLELLNDTWDYIEILIDDYDYWDENESAEVEADFEELRNETDILYNKTADEVQELIDDVEAFSSSLSELEKDLNRSQRLNKAVQAKIGSAKNNLADIQSSFIELKNSLEKSKQSLESISITRAETIVSPVSTKIEPVVAETPKQTFMFPFLLILVIMFVALLLSSTLIMFEKNSKAFFRNVITPTRSTFFVITTFITSFIVIILQTLVILGLANYFLHIPLFKNALSTLLIIFVISTLFIVLGMAVGYFFSTQEGAIMASVVLGSVFMFLSNLVIPLESLAPALSGVIKYNPYVLASEMLRKSLLFKIETQEVLTGIFILFGAALAVFLLTLLFQSLSTRRRIKEVKEARDLLEDKLIKEKSPKPVVKKKVRPLNKMDVLKTVSNMTKAEFEDAVNLKQNKVADLIERKIEDKKLAHKLRKTTSKKEIMHILAESIRKELRKKKPKKEGPKA